MPTLNDKKDEFKPRKQVPSGGSIIVHYSGKPPKPSCREIKGRKVYEVTFWLGIADKAYPELVGQYHPFIVTAWISPPREIEVEGERKPIQASKLYKTLLAIASQETADKFAYHDASITEAEIAATDDEGKRAELQERFVDPEWWKPLRGFYIAEFREPRKDKTTGEIMLAENGGVFFQEVAGLKPLKVARIMNEEQLKENIIWPPLKDEAAASQQTPASAKPLSAGPAPKPGTAPAPANLPTPPQAPPPPAQGSGIGLPTKPGANPMTGTKPPEPERPAPQKEAPKEPAKREPLPEEVLESPELLKRAKGFYDKGDPYAGIVAWFMGQKGKAKASQLDVNDQRHLLAVLRLTEYALGEGQPANLIAQHLKTRGKMTLQELEFKDACALLYSCDLAEMDDTPF